MQGRYRTLVATLTILGCPALAAGQEIGAERAVTAHLDDGEEFSLSYEQLANHGRLLFDARWTIQEGGGRPFATGTGAPLADPASPLVFPRNTNRISGPDATACAGCHNQPRSGGAGDIVANVFVLGQRFDFATFDPADPIPTRGTVDETGMPVTLGNIANERNTPGLFGSGYIEMLARQITVRLQEQRDALEPGDSVELVAKDIGFGTLRRRTDGSWDTGDITALPAPSLRSSGPDDPPSLILRPFHQAGAVVSIRQFSNNAFNHHHGIQAAERFGPGDPDGDGHSSEMTRADVTAVSVFQATLAVPGRVIPRERKIEAAVLDGERLFLETGCADCHVPSLPLTDGGWFYSEPNPFNPPGNLQPGQAAELAVDLTNGSLEQPRLNRDGDVVHVPAYTDFKLHDITSGPDDPNCESLDMHFAPGTAEFLADNCRFLTARLWGVASTGPYFHHGKYSTMREAIGAHRGAAAYSTDRWTSLTDYERNAVIEFLKTLRVLPAGTRHRVVDETFKARPWRGILE